MSDKVRPECNKQAPNLLQPLPILYELLAVERARLETAVRIERERSIVFPETSIIIRDIERLVVAITRAERGEEMGAVRVDARVTQGRERVVLPASGADEYSDFYENM